MSLSEINVVRIEAIFNALERNVKAAGELLAEADRAERRVAIKRGKRTEERFLRYVQTIPQVSDTRISSFEEDGRGIDFWLSFINRVGLPTLPVQIKSSQKAVERFVKSKKYRDLGGRILVINTGPRVSRTKFKERFQAEVRRVRRKF